MPPPWPHHRRGESSRSLDRQRVEMSGHCLVRRLATGRCYHLGTNKEVFDAETFAIHQTLRALDQRQESGHRYTVFADSTSAIDRVRSNALGPGQRFAMAAIEVCSRVLARDNEVTIRWVPSHSKASGNEVADEYAKAAAMGEAPLEETPEGYRDEASLSHMTRTATETRSRETAEWISRYVGAERRYRPPSGRGLRRPQLRQVKNTLAGRYYQLLSGHAATRPHLLRIKKTDTSECWRCASGEPQSRPHFFT